MRKFSQVIKEGFNNPGNSLLKTGVTNHYTPINNILTNVKNLFCSLLGVVAEIGEDEVSLKLSSSQFTTKQKTQELLYRTMYGEVYSYGCSSLANYIMSQGLTKMTIINIGSFYVVYFSPTDIMTAQDPYNMVSTCNCPCPSETCESLENEFELSNFITEDDSEEELKNLSLEKIKELLKSKDKVKAAKQIETIVAQDIELPREYYFAGIKFKSDDEAIALRWKYTKKLPSGKSIENVRSIMHIFADDNQIWVQDFSKESIVKLPDEVEKLIKSILDIFDAKETKDPAIFTLNDKSDKDEDKEKNNEEDEKNEKDTEDKKSNDDDDTESDKDRGDSSDDLL